MEDVGLTEYAANIDSLCCRSSSVSCRPRFFCWCDLERLLGLCPFFEDAVEDMDTPLCRISKDTVE
jgi:hypothetical protein